MPPATEQLIELKDVTVTYALGSRFGTSHTNRVKACDHVSLQLREGEVLALVGETGSGKSTVGRVIAGLQRPDEGSVLFRGRNLFGRDVSRSERTRTVQMIFQDPRSSLNPRWKVGKSLLRPMSVNGLLRGEAEVQAARRLLDEVQLAPEITDRYPHELSGGQAQRVCIARALSLSPAVVVADEALSGLDVTTQVGILNLLHTLRTVNNTAFLFISHDLRVVKGMSNRVAVMHRGRIVETAETEALFAEPKAEYTRALLNDVVHHKEQPNGGPSSEAPVGTGYADTGITDEH